MMRRLPSGGEIAFMFVFMAGLLTIGLAVLSGVAWLIETVLNPATYQQLAAGAPWLLVGVGIGILISYLALELDSE